MDWSLLQKQLRRPRAFATGSGLFWADPYIASHVLYAHLDGRSDDASRNLPTIEREVDWIHEQFPQPGTLLDLGCGPGLHSLLLANRGWQVTGIDASPSCIAYAQKEALDAGLAITYLKGDFHRLTWPTNLDCILLAYGTMGTLSPLQAQRLVQKCWKTLNPGGRLIFDVFQSAWWEKQRRSLKEQSWDFLTTDGFWAPGSHLVLSRQYVYSKLRAFGQIYTVIEAHRTCCYPFWYRWYNDQLLQTELLNGWKVAFYRNLQGQSYRPQGPWVAVVASREENELVIRESV